MTFGIYLTAGGLLVRVSQWCQVVEMNVTSINFGSCWKLFLSLSPETYKIKKHCPWCITFVYCPEKKILKISNHLLKCKTLEMKINNFSWSIRSIRSKISSEQVFLKFSKFHKEVTELGSLGHRTFGDDP